MESNFFETLVHAIENNQADMVCCNCIDEGIGWQSNKCIERQEFVTEQDKMFRHYFDGKRYAYVIWGKLYRKEFIEKIEFINIRYTEDTHMILEAFSIAKGIVLVPYAGYHYRAQENSAMATANLVELCKDKLVTAEYLISSCANLGEELCDKSCVNMVNCLYEAILAQVKAVSGKTKAFPENWDFKHYYNMIRKQMSFNRRGMLLRMYNVSPAATNFLLKLFYIMKKWKRKPEKET